MRSRIVLDTRVSPDDRVHLVVRYSKNGRFSIAASVKFRPDDFMLLPFCASATDAPRGSCFSSRLAPSHLMMG
jgi:hypothetical protein